MKLTAEQSRRANCPGDTNPHMRIDCLQGADIAPRWQRKECRAKDRDTPCRDTDCLKVASAPIESARNEQFVLTPWVCADSRRSLTVKGDTSAKLHITQAHECEQRCVVVEAIAGMHEDSHRSGIAHHHTLVASICGGALRSEDTHSRSEGGGTRARAGGCCSTWCPIACSRTGQCLRGRSIRDFDGSSLMK